MAKDSPLKKEDTNRMRHFDKFSAFETTGGKYSTHKVPRWRMGQNEILEYLEFADIERDDFGFQGHPA